MSDWRWWDDVVFYIFGFGWFWRTHPAKDAVDQVALGF
jgi:hypothetical protein